MISTRFLRIPVTWGPLGLPCLTSRKLLLSKTGVGFLFTICLSDLYRPVPRKRLIRLLVAFLPAFRHSLQGVFLVKVETVFCNAISQEAGSNMWDRHQLMYPLASFRDYESIDFQTCSILSRALTV